MGLQIIGVTPTYAEQTGATSPTTPSNPTTGSGGSAVGVAGASIDASGHLIVTLTDGRQIDAGAMPAGSGSAPDLTLTVGTVTTAAHNVAASARLVRTGASAFRLDLTIPVGTPGQPRYTGSGAPPSFIAGSTPGDQYLDTSSGSIYTLR